MHGDSEASLVSALDLAVEQLSDGRDVMSVATTPVEMTGDPPHRTMNNEDTYTAGVVVTVVWREGA